jgi:hypothetical protein
VIRRVREGLPARRDRIAEQDRLLHGLRLRLELVGEGHAAGAEAGPLLLRDAVALEAVDAGLGLHAVLLGRHAEAVRPRDDERMIAELVA